MPFLRKKGSLTLHLALVLTLWGCVRPRPYLGGDTLERGRHWIEVSQAAKLHAVESIEKRDALPIYLERCADPALRSRVRFGRYQHPRQQRACDRQAQRVVYSTTQTLPAGRHWYETEPVQFIQAGKRRLTFFAEYDNPNFNSGSDAEILGAGRLSFTDPQDAAVNYQAGDATDWWALPVVRSPWVWLHTSVQSGDGWSDAVTVSVWRIKEQKAVQQVASFALGRRQLLRLRPGSVYAVRVQALPLSARVDYVLQAESFQTGDAPVIKMVDLYNASSTAVLQIQHGAALGSERSAVVEIFAVDKTWERPQATCRITEQRGNLLVCALDKPIGGDRRRWIARLRPTAAEF